MSYTRSLCFSRCDRIAKAKFVHKLRRMQPQLIQGMKLGSHGLAWPDIEVPKLVSMSFAKLPLRFIMFYWLGTPARYTMY